MMPRAFLKQLLSHVGQFTAQLILHVVPNEGLQINTLDGSQVCVIRLKVYQRGMEAYKWNMSQPREFHLGIFVQPWIKAIDNAASRHFEFVRLVLSPTTDWAWIELLEYVGNREKGIPRPIDALSEEAWEVHETYSISLGDFQQDSFQTDSMDSVIMFALPSRTFYDKMNSWSKIGDQATFHFDGSIEQPSIANSSGSSSKKAKTSAAVVQSKVPDDEWPDDEQEETKARSKLKVNHSAPIPTEPPCFVTRKLDITCRADQMESTTHIVLMPLAETNVNGGNKPKSNDAWVRSDLRTVPIDSVDPEEEEIPAGEVVSMDTDDRDVSLISFGSMTAFEAIRSLMQETRHELSTKSRIVMQTRSTVQFNNLHSGIVLQERVSKTAPEPLTFSIRYLLKASAGTVLSDTVIIGLYQTGEREFATVTFDMKERGALSTIVAAIITEK